MYKNTNFPYELKIQESELKSCKWVDNKTALEIGNDMTKYWVSLYNTEISRKSNYVVTGDIRGIPHKMHLYPR